MIIEVRLQGAIGPFRGRVFEFSDVFEPDNVLHRLRHFNCNWRLRFVDCSPEIQKQWERADLAIRVLRAGQRRLPVRFVGFHYKGDLLSRYLDELARMSKITIVHDDSHRGLFVIGQYA